MFVSPFSEIFVDLGVNENIVIIGDPSGDPSKTDMPDRRPIGDRHV